MSDKDKNNRPNDPSSDPLAELSRLFDKEGTAPKDNKEASSYDLAQSYSKSHHSLDKELEDNLEELLTGQESRPPFPRRSAGPNFTPDPPPMARDMRAGLKHPFAPESFAQRGAGEIAHPPARPETAPSDQLKQELARAESLKSDSLKPEARQAPLQPIDKMLEDTDFTGEAKFPLNYENYKANAPNPAMEPTITYDESGILREVPPAAGDNKDALFSAKDAPPVDTFSFEDASLNNSQNIAEFFAPQSPPPSLKEEPYETPYKEAFPLNNPAFAEFPGPSHSAQQPPPFMAARDQHRIQEPPVLSENAQQNYQQPVFRSYPQNFSADSQIEGFNDWHMPQGSPAESRHNGDHLGLLNGQALENEDRSTKQKIALASIGAFLITIAAIYFYSNKEQNAPLPSVIRADNKPYKIAAEQEPVLEDESIPGFTTYEHVAKNKEKLTQKEAELNNELAFQPKIAPKPQEEKELDEFALNELDNMASEQQRDSAPLSAPNQRSEQQQSGPIAKQQQNAPQPDAAQQKPLPQDRTQQDRAPQRAEPQRAMPQAPAPHDKGAQDLEQQNLNHFKQKAPPAKENHQQRQSQGQLNDQELNGQAQNSQQQKPSPAPSSANGKANEAAKAAENKAAKAAQPHDKIGAILKKQNKDSAKTINSQPAAHSGKYFVQLAAQPQMDLAQLTLQKLKARYGSLMRGHELIIQKADIKGKGIFYRIRIAHNSKEGANALCHKLQQAGASCFVTR